MKQWMLILLLFLGYPVWAQVLNDDWTILNGAADPKSEEKDPYWNLHWHSRLASYGDPDSQFYIAQVYEQGNLVPRNISKAIEYYRRAAQQGHLESCWRLAHLLPDEEEKWYLFAAEHNDPQAQIKLAKFYESHGDKEQAIIWYERAFRFLFPETDDLTTISPDLKRLKEAS